MPSLPPPALACNATRLSAAGGSGTDALTARMLPSLFVPGMPKAGTSFVWGCLMEAFRPSRVCQSDSASDWRQCAGRQYVLPALTAGRDGLVSPAAKEPFTFVRDGGLDWTALKSGDPSALGQLLGPALPLCQWEFDQQAATIPATVEASSTFRLRKFLASRDRHESPRLAALRQALKHRMSLYCRQGVPNMVTTRRMSCVTSEDGTTSFRTALPVVSEMGTARARVVDATPNYLTSPDALRRIHWLHAAAPSAVRFVVLLRDPIERTLSEYRMFHAWGWDRGALAPKLERQIAELGRCWDATFAAAAHGGGRGGGRRGGSGGGSSKVPQPARSMTLDGRAELTAHVPAAWARERLLRCFDYGHPSTRYVRNSLIEVGLHAAHSLFERSQFMHVWMEDLRITTATQLITRLAAFSGLSLPPRRPIIGKCQTPSARAPCPRHASIVLGQRCQRRGGNSSRLDNATLARLRRFFAPSLASLATLLPGTFDAAAPLQRLTQIQGNYAG